MNRFHAFATNHFADDLSELKIISTEEIKSLLYDYLSVEYFEYCEDELDDVEALVNHLEPYLEDPKTFYFNLIVDLVNIINFSGHKGIVMQLGDKNQYHEDSHHYYYMIDLNGDMRESFMFLYHSFYGTKEIEKVK